MECYSRLFLEPLAEDGGELSSCPYCGATVEEIARKKLVGCAHCYQTLWAGVFPLVEKMQGTRAHRGKTPPLDGEYADPYDYENTVGAAYRAKAVERARYDRQRTELETIIRELKGQGDIEGARCYEEKLTAMKKRLAVEEDFVWRTRLETHKQS